MSSTNHALHQVRVSQVPLRPTEIGVTSYQQQPEIDKDGIPERHSALNHVRYNIVGKPL